MLHSSLWQRAAAALVFVMLLALLLPTAVFAHTTIAPFITLNPTSGTDGHFTASNVHYNPNTNELSFTGTGITPSAATYDSIGISNCNTGGDGTANCANSSDEFWGPPDYFTNHQNLPLSDPQNFDMTLAFNPYRPSAGTVYVWIDTPALDRIYSQALDYNSIIALTNTPPQVNTFSGATINEGDTYSANGSFTDPDSTSWTVTVNYGDGAEAQNLTLSGTNFTLSHLYKDNGAYTVTVRVTDNQGTTGTGTAAITVNNVAPTVGTITAPTSPVQVNTAITASANFTDSGVLDTHTAVWDWGDGTVCGGNPDLCAGTVTESNGSGSVSNSHTYTSAGVYPIKLTVTDKDGATGTQMFQYVSVYNPTAQGLFSAGEKYTSPTGAYAQNPSLTGTVHFGLSYKYQGTVPTGNRQFSMDFNQANFHFNATSISSLVIANGIATLTGTGTVNGSGTYNFLVTGSESAKTIRIQIKDQSGNVIYDTQPGAAATATPTTSVTGTVLAH